MPGAIVPEPSTKVFISFSAFRQNLDAVRLYVGPDVKILAVVKADAYGHGAIQMAREAISWGVTYLGVARIHEGVELRKAGIQAPILVFETAPSAYIPLALEEGLDLTVVSLRGAELISRTARATGLTANVHIKVDTGMGRLGIPHDRALGEVLSIVDLPACSPIGLYSHFATSEDADQSFALLQLDRFSALCGKLDRKGVTFPIRHMANSGAIMTLPASHLDMVRPGIMLYGYPPGEGMTERYPVRPVMSLVSRLAMVKTVVAGTPISYGRRHTTGSRTRIGTIAAGYADGYPRSLTNRGTVLIRGTRYPVVGTVCMDYIMVDLGDSGIEEGTEVTLIGAEGDESISAWDIARMAGTIPYEITCLVPKRVPRLYGT